MAVHEALRTRFVQVEGEPRPADRRGDWFLLRQHVPDEGRVGCCRRGSAVEAEGASVFDWSRGRIDPRSGAAARGPGHVLLLTMHQIVSAGGRGGCGRRASWTRLSARVERTPSVAGIEYADLRSWERSRLSGDALQRSASNWRESLAVAPAYWSFPATVRVQVVRTSRRSAVDIVGRGASRAPKRLSLQQGERLHDAAELRQRCSLAPVKRTWWSVVRAAGRRRVEAGATEFGFFVDTLALRLDLWGADAAEPPERPDETRPGASASRSCH